MWLKDGVQGEVDEEDVGGTDRGGNRGDLQGEVQADIWLRLKVKAIHYAVGTGRYALQRSRGGGWGGDHRAPS